MDLGLTNSEFNSIHFGVENYLLWCSNSTPKCIELNSGFVRLKKTWVLGLALALGPDSKPKPNP